jgi:hypothetical protein
MSPHQFGRTTQARFLLDAHLHGLEVLIPFDLATGYDFVVDNGQRLIRVEVKGVTPSGKRNYYSVNIRRFGRHRKPRFDVCAVWMAREQRWAFLPRSTRNRTMVRLTPFGKFSRTDWSIFSK